jgi:hypothetical protein
MTVFKPFLRQVEGQDTPWGDTMWFTQLTNELRAAAGYPLTRHNDVMRAVRGAMDKLGPQINARNFAHVTYTDKKGEQRPMIQFSHNVFFNVVGSVGGPVEQLILYKGNLELNRLKAVERAGEVDRAGDDIGPGDIVIRGSRRSVQRRSRQRACASGVHA